MGSPSTGGGAGGGGTSNESASTATGGTVGGDEIAFGGINIGEQGRPGDAFNFSSLSPTMVMTVGGLVIGGIVLTKLVSRRR